MMNDIINNYKYINRKNHDKESRDGDDGSDGDDGGDGCVRSSVRSSVISMDGGDGGDGGNGGYGCDGGDGGDGGDGCDGGDRGDGGDGCNKEENNNLLSESINNNGILNELFINQLKNINPKKKLNYCDIQRISKFLKSSIFSNTCSLWTGYITNDKNINKGVYINFYFNKRI